MNEQDKQTRPRRSRDKDEWERTTLAEQLAKGGERSVEFTTVSNLPIQRLATAEDLAEDWNPAHELGLPGEYPYTRGIHPTMFRGRMWTMRQFAGFGSAAETNERFKYLLSQGQTGLSTAFDLPTLMGRDSDDEMAQGEVGKEGVAIDTVVDMKRLFDDR